MHIVLASHIQYAGHHDDMSMSLTVSWSVKKWKRFLSKEK